MHDLTFAKEILDALDQKARSMEKGSVISAVSASLSPISHVKPETLKETFAVLAKDTPFSGVKLKISILRLGIKCESCKHGFVVDKPTMQCPECHSSDLNIIYSKEFQVDSIEVKKKASKRPWNGL